jgi:hypothetical protein
MTGKEFVTYLVESGLFREKIPAYVVDNPITCNRIPSNIKYNFPRQFSYDIEVSYTPNLRNRVDVDWQGGLTVDFYFGANNLHASEKLSDLDFPKLVEIMSKFCSGHKEFEKWKKEYQREYNLSLII